MMQHVTNAIICHKTVDCGTARERYNSVLSTARNLRVCYNATICSANVASLATEGGKHHRVVHEFQTNDVFEIKKAASHDCDVKQLDW